jgi:hypothetical protein
MAEEIVKTIENVDKLFSQIVVNGEVHNSSNYVPPAQLRGNTPRNSAGSRNTVQGEDVYGVNLNDTLHNFTDRTVAEALAEEASARQLADEVIRSNIENINDKIPSSATVSNKLVDNASMTSAINVVQAGLSDLEALVPAQASANNKLADKAFVNSSIATNTANFLGTYNSLSEIQAIQNPTNNDYAFLQTTDSVGNRQYDRYKFSSSDNQWHYEYTLNNSSFTAEQWATINSGLTQASVNQAIASACAYCASSNTNVTGASLYTGATLKILFTAQIAGADTSSALTITYNNSPYTVKVAKDGSLVDFTAKASGNAFVYCQAYTTLELMFDGTNFIIIGNPVVISNSDYTVYADGSITYTSKQSIINAETFGVDNSTVTKHLESGLYLYFSNFHPANVNSIGLYYIFIQSYSDYSVIKTIVQDNNIALTLQNNTLSVTANVPLRGLLLRVSKADIV